MEYVLEVRDLTKKYGDKQALGGISFGVKAGSCFGLLGPNGAGKSTAMKIITGVTEADQGSVTVLGMERRKQDSAIRGQVGYVPQELTLYDLLSARSNLVFFGEMYGVRGGDLKRRIEEVLEQVGLSDRAKDPIRTFSGGMKRRINIAAALLHNPKLVILDEPTVGIDPQSRNHIFEMIRQLKKDGVTLVYSTHYMEEVEALCDDIAIIDHGKVIAQGSLDLLLDQYAVNAVYVETGDAEALPGLPGLTRTYAQGKGLVLECGDPVSLMREASARLMERGAAVTALEMMRPSLESVFLKLTGTSLRD